MKYKILITSIIMSILSPSLVNAVPKQIYNPHTGIYKLDIKKHNKLKWTGEPIEFLVTCEEQKYWLGENVECKKDWKVISEHPYWNSYALNIVDFFGQRMLNTTQYSTIGLIALFNKICPELYRDDKSIIRYPWDIRQVSAIGFVKDNIWDWREAEYYLNFRLGLYPLEKINYKEWREKLDDVLLTNLIQIPMWTNPLPHLRQNPILPNNKSDRQDFTYARKTRESFWMFGDTYSKWYIPDIFNSLIGELDIKLGSPNLSFVDQKYIRRHDKRNVTTTIPNVPIKDMKENMILTYTYQKVFNLAEYGTPTLFSDIEAILEDYLKPYVDKLDDTKFHQDTFNQFINDVIIPLVKKGNKHAIKLYEEMSTIYWWYMYYITAKDVKYVS